MNDKTDLIMGCVCEDGGGIDIIIPTRYHLVVASDFGEKPLQRK